jgi:hypothetical protein
MTNPPTPQRPPPQPPRPQAPPPPKPDADPQAAKVEAHAKVEFTPKPAIDPRAEKPPAGAYADGMTSAEEQRARSAWIEQHGDAAYREAVEERPVEDRVNKQVPGVVPPTKRE